MAEPSSIEKGLAVHDTSASHTSSTIEPPFDKAAERRLLRKLDFRLLPVLWILYLVNFIDRANIGNAKIQGMEKELHLVGQRFNTCVWVFNLGYLVFGIPLQLVFKHYGPKSLCIMILCWGITVIGCGVVKTWEQLVVCRLLEGIAESAFIAGAAYLVGAYYTKAEYLSRYVIIYTATIIAGAINGFLSALIAKMDGVSNYSAWRWIFIIEGCITVVVSIASWFLMPPWPEDCKFLSAESKALLLARSSRDGGHVTNDKVSPKQILKYLCDWRLIAAVIMYLGCLENANSLANFMPTIVLGLGYKKASDAQVHTIPIYMAGAAFVIAMSFLSERVQRRYHFYMLGWSILVVGLAIELAYPPNAKVRYMAVFFVSSGCWLGLPVALIWATINSGRGTRRAIMIAAIQNFGTAGAFISSNVFIFKETPRFRTGFTSNMVLACVGATAATVTYIGCRYENRKRDKMQSDTTQVVDQSAVDADTKHPSFRYAV